MSSRNHELLIPQKAPLRNEDSETQTYGCRHTNPDICSSNSLQGVCAFVKRDAVCSRPPRSWKRLYEELKGGAK